MDKSTTKFFFSEFLEQNQIKILIFLLFLTVILRLTILAFTGIEAPIKDAATYDSIAWNILQGQGFFESTLTHWATSLRVGPG